MEEVEEEKEDAEIILETETENLEETQNEHTLAVETESLGEKGEWKEIQTIKNKYPDEALPKDGKLYGKAKIVDGKITIDGQLPRDVDFVVTKKGELLLGKRHHFLGNAKDVEAAGTLKISNGKVKRISNNSGHYLPTPEQTEIFVEIFKTLGVDLKRTNLEIFYLDEVGNLVSITKPIRQ